ncbi:hybrid sensor histidine kinase/response regulator [Chromobacterium sp. ATCC 53434]|uniref:two component system sensor kinase n=1 Tax=Chromobacterium sp. (strain ATCC 53434 / SC 14030) TaxID=2059672 RepID=UPI000C784560|nr:two component system sensor kinase [Chromobacterium sp. ATCC 53434]AUH50646.1 hybrid sensor histidine kinase/response regulator [Chromobacterium sp. ATCC 53434]
MKKLWETALTWRLVITLGCAIIIFWLSSECIVFYSRYTSTQSIIRNELSLELSASVNEESSHYQQAERRIHTLSNLWSSMREGADLDVMVGRVVFVPFPGAKPDPRQLKKAMQMVEIFGDANESSNEATFIMLPKQGFVFFNPNSLSDAYLKSRMRILSQLVDTPGVHGFHWGRPFWDINKKLYVSVAEIQPDTGVMIGKNVEVWRMPMPNHELSDDITFAMLAHDGEWLPVATTDKAIPFEEFPATRFPPCNDDASVRIDDFYYVCKPLRGPPWSVIARYPQRAVASKSLDLLLGTLPSTAVMLSMLLVIMFLVLKLQVGSPLQRIIGVIDHFKLLDLDYRLPDNREDELGRIAKAYNKLLATIRSHYRTLEARVHKRTQELDEARKIAELMSRRKSEHIASISHEIRTPLNGVVGALSLLQRGTMTSQQRELVDTARFSTDYLLVIINDLLDFSHIEAGQLELTYESASVLQILDQVMLTIHLRAQEKGLALSALVTDEVPAEISLDRMRVQQILINLLGNAVKFTERGHIRLSAARRGGMLAIEIEDTGPGIAEDKQLDIFRPFIQIRTHDGGNGLGLTIASRLSNLMGGEILLRSEVGKGSRFTLMLPLNNPLAKLEKFSGPIIAPAVLHPQLRIWGMDPQEGEHSRLESPALAYLPERLWRSLRAITRNEELIEDAAAPLSLCPWSLKVLLVDDVSINRDIVSRMLLELGHQVETAASGREALEYGGQAVYDLVLMDVRMPEMDGYETTRRWRDSDADVLDVEVPIIALTANAMSGEGERVKAAGMNGYLAKPLSLDQLMRAIELAVSLQLARGAELMPNAQLQKPMLDLDDDDLQDKLSVTLRSFGESIDKAWTARQTQELLSALHALKGCVGLAGVQEVYQCCEQLETRVLQGIWPSRQDMASLQALLKSEGYRSMGR